MSRRAAETVFVGCGFAAKYPEGGGNFSVPLQWLLGLRRLRRRGIWLEVLPASGRAEEDRRRIRHFEAQLAEHGLDGDYCLLYQAAPRDEHALEATTAVGLSHAELRRLLAGPNTLLNLCYSIHPPLLLDFERRILCDLDPGEFTYWMSRTEMGQSSHHDFWTIGLNVNAPDCRRPRGPVTWRTFPPLVDTALHAVAPPPPRPRFSTVTQWYWKQHIEVDGALPDLSKRTAFERYLGLPALVPDVEFELAVNLTPDDPETERLRRLGWRRVEPHAVAGTPRAYRAYIAAATGELTPCKGLDRLWRTGWLSDRAAAYLATGRPVITEDTGAAGHLPPGGGLLWVSGPEEAVDAVHGVVRAWEDHARRARAMAVELFDAPATLRRILD